VFSENMGPEQYLVLAEKIGEAIRAGYAGIVVGHGTDTMHHTAAALSFMVQRPPVPIVMVGSQRSSDRPSSDAALNLINGTWAAAHGPIAEVMVCMFGPTSDRYNLLHRGTRVRKMHSSYRSTFRTVGDVPLAMVEGAQLTPLKEDFRPRRADREVRIQAAYDDRVTLLYYYPGMQPDVLDAMVEKGYHGIIIAGTGLGHVNRKIYPALERAHAAGVHLFMTLQTLWGFVQMQVYETGREILQLGVVPLANMMPEVAFVKLGWALGLHPGDPAAVRALMTTPIAGDMTEREPHDGYLILQGGVPEVKEYLGKVWR
jgi:glutamyl-tRNA(Gln) amidotransferase subunit D